MCRRDGIGRPHHARPLPSNEAQPGRDGTAPPANPPVRQRGESRIAPFDRQVPRRIESKRPTNIHVVGNFTQLLAPGHDISPRMRCEHTGAPAVISQISRKRQRPLYPGTGRLRRVVIRNHENRFHDNGTRARLSNLVGSSDTNTIVGDFPSSPFCLPRQEFKRLFLGTPK